MKTKRRKDFNLRMPISQKSSKMWTAKSGGFGDKVAVLNILHLPLKIHSLSCFVPKKVDLTYFISNIFLPSVVQLVLGNGRQ